jgi:hypothetical protein
MVGCADSSKGRFAATSTGFDGRGLPVAFVRAPDLRARCSQVARVVGYGVPCPTWVPRGLVPTQGTACRFHIVGVSCSDRWRGWVVGSSDVAGQHLVITAAPRVIGNYAHVVNGPVWRPEQRVRVGGWVTVNRWRARWIFVTPQTNEGSAFAGHHVLAWTTRGHTYAIGFHETSTAAAARAMDLALLRHLEIVNPPA